MTPNLMVEAIREHAADWQYEAVSIGYPGLVGGIGRTAPRKSGPG